MIILCGQCKYTTAQNSSDGRIMSFLELNNKVCGCEDETIMFSCRASGTEEGGVRERKHINKLLLISTLSESQ